MPINTTHPVREQTDDSPADRGIRVTFINRYFYPDVSATGQILFDLSRRLVKQGFEVSVVCSRQLYGHAQAELPAEDLIEGIKVYRVRTTSFGRDNLFGRALDYLSFYFTAGFKLLKITQPGDVLVAKTDPPLISLVAGAVARWRGARLVNWLQDLFPEVVILLGKGLPGWIYRILLHLRDRSLKVASANVVIGTAMRDRLLKHHIDASTIHVIENWADSNYVSPKPASQSRVRSDLALHDKFVVSYSGNLGRAHEFETILQAAIALRHDRDVVFLMIGGGVKSQQLVKEAKKHQLNNFVFLPYQPRENLADSMAAGDVHLISLLPNLEGLIVPSKFYGILAAGRPSIVIGDVNGELAHIVRDEGCGEAVAVQDGTGLTDVIRKLKMDPQRCRQMSDRANALFVERYTADRGVQKWIKVLEEIHNK